MRVAYVCADQGVPVFGTKGASVHVQEVIRALGRQGATVELFAARLGSGPDGNGVPPDLADLPVHPLPAARGADSAERERHCLAANADLSRALDAASRDGGPFDLVYERYALWSFAGMAWAREHGIPGVLEVNAPLVSEQARHRGLVDRAAAERVVRDAARAATAVCCVSQPVADWVGSLGVGANVEVIPNGVDPARFAAAAAAARDPAALTVTFVGTLKPWHGVETLVDAVAILAATPAPGGCPPRRVRLLVVGHGPEREALEVRVAAVGLAEATTFSGAVTPAAVPALLAGADVGVAPYPDDPEAYFSPLKLYEYLAAGLAVVASDVGQAAEVLDHDRNGLLVVPGDVRDLADALVALRDDPARVARLAAAGREQVTRSHTWDSVAARIVAFAGGRALAGAAPALASTS